MEGLELLVGQPWFKAVRPDLNRKPGPEVSKRRLGFQVLDSAKKGQEEF